MNFHVGQKVVCVDDRPPSDGSSVRVVLNAVYTIREFDIEHPNGIFGVILEEICSRVPRGFKQETGWRPERFRPLIERKSSTDTGFSVLDDIRKRESVEQHGKYTITRRAEENDEPQEAGT